MADYVKDADAWRSITAITMYLEEEPVVYGYATQKLFAPSVKKLSHLQKFLQCQHDVFVLGD